MYAASGIPEYQRLHTSAHLQEVNDVNCTCMQLLVFQNTRGYIHPLIFRRSMMLIVHVCSLWYSRIPEAAYIRSSSGGQ